MQSNDKTDRTLKRGGAARKGPQCNQIAGSVAWKNRKFSFRVCAASAEKAAGKVTDALIKQKVEDEARKAIGLDCSDGQGCGDTQKCLPGDVACQTTVTKKPAAASCRADPNATCTAPETGWICDIWADVTATQQCVCKVPG